MLKKKFFILFLLLGIPSTHADLIYPIQEMSKVECRFQNFSTLSSECKMDLPILKTQDYTKYKNDYSLYRRVYTILWGATYNYGWDVGNGWHQWVDIATAEGTPVYSISDGKVIQAWFLAGRGNNVKVEHVINGRKIYSNYSHLSKIDVSVWNNVKTKTKIWEVGNTGNSFWNHLHFQIDLATSGKGPWYRSNCSEKNYDKIVNTDVCFSQLNTNTIDPLLFLETGGAVVQASSVNKPNNQNISQEWLLSREEILKREIAEFLKTYQVQVKIMNLWWNLEMGKKGTLKIIVIDKRTKRPFTWSFPWDMNFKFDSKKLDVFPTGILQIDRGERDFTITPKMPGKSSIDIYIWETFFKKLSFWVFDTSKEIIPKQTVFSVSNNNVLSETKKGVLYFKDNYGINILWFDFQWKYKLSSENNSVKFCLKKVNNIWELSRIFNTNCKDDQFKNQIEFSAQDAMQWIILFNYKVLSQKRISLIVTQTKWGEVWMKKINGVLPQDVKNVHPYFDDIVNLSEKWWVSWINKGYFLPDRNLTKEDGILFLKNYLETKYNACSLDSCKITYAQNILALNKENSDRYSYFTRWEYLELVGKYSAINEYTWGDFMIFRDLDEQNLRFSKNILKNKTWNDYFWETRYFQPTKTITRWEAAFLLNQIVH